jgi:hypothetical protein
LAVERPEQRRDRWIEPSLQLSRGDEVLGRYVPLVHCADEAVLNFVQRSASDAKEPREFAVAPAAKPLGHIPTDRVRRIVKLRPQLQVTVEGRAFRQTEDFEAMLITESPDDQLGEVTRDGHRSPSSTTHARVASTT